MNQPTFNEFCHKYCDGLYDPLFEYEKQCTGYKQLRKMVVDGVSPATLEDIERWEKNPTPAEVIAIPDIKYLRFLHHNLRSYIIENWSTIKNLQV